MKRVSFYTLGCKLNFAETSGLERQFADRGYSVVEFDDQADVCVVNTCSVTRRAERECRQIVRRALRISPEAFVLVLGCYAQLAPEEIASMNGVDAVLGTSEKCRVFDYLPDFRKHDVPKIFVSPIQQAVDFGPAYSGGLEGRTRAFLKIQDGCDFNCSFCTIPLARGESRSQSPEVTVEQARELAARGYKEIVLTGVNVGDYGKRAGTSLLALLRMLEDVNGIERIRISSIEPNLIDPELLTFWLSSRKVCHHFHIPLQSGSDRILRRMRRRYTVSSFRNLIHSIRERAPSAGIGVDVIAGFPGETEDAFTETCDFLHHVPVTYLHVFTYSERPNTPSVGLDGRVEPRIRFKRSEVLRMLGQKKKTSFIRSQVGHLHTVLIEGEVEGNMLSGYTDNYVRVRVPYHPSLENAIADVRIGEMTSDGCRGVVENIRSSSVPPSSVRLPIINERLM